MVASKRADVSFTVFGLTGEYGLFQGIYGLLIILVFNLSLYETPSSTFFFHDIPHRCSFGNDSSFSSDKHNSSVEVAVSKQEFSLSCEGHNSVEFCEKHEGHIEYDCCYPFRDSVVSQFDLICENRHFKSFAESNLGIGFLVSSLFFGQLSDKIGRRKVALYSLFLKIFTSLFLSISSEYYQFVIAYFISCMLHYGIFLSLYVLLTESFGSSRRNIVSFKCEMSGITSDLFVGLAFYLSTSWHQVPLVYTFTTLIAFFIVFVFIYESPLWLISQGRWAEAEIVIKRMAALNRRLISPSSMIKLKEASLSKSDKPKERSNVNGDHDTDDLEHKIESLVKNSAIDLFKHPVVRIKSFMIMFNWFAVTSAFYAIYLNMTSWEGMDPYLSFVYGVIISFPSIIAFVIGIQYFGRRTVFCLTMSGGALCGCFILLVSSPMFISTFTESFKDKMIVMFSIFGKFFFGAAFGTLYIWSSELYPTPVRNVGMGMSSVCGRIGLLLVPFVLEYGVIAQAVVSMVGFVAAFQSCLLPETLGHPLLQNVKDSQLVTIRSWTDLCSRKGKKGDASTRSRIMMSVFPNGDKLIDKEQQKGLISSDSESDSEYEEVNSHFTMDDTRKDTNEEEDIISL